MSAASPTAPSVVAKLLEHVALEPTFAFNFTVLDYAARLAEGTQEYQELRAALKAAGVLVVSWEKAVKERRALPPTKAPLELEPGGFDEPAVYDANDDGDDRHNDLTESGFAETIARDRSSDLRFVSSWGKWIACDGNRWSLAHGREVAERAPKQISASLFARADGARSDREAKKYVDAAMKLRKRSTRESVVALARWERELTIHHDELDKNAEHLVVTPSGMVDLRTGELAANDPRLLLTRATSTPYVPGATCPTWETFVSEIAGGDQALVGYLQRAVGYSLTGSIREHVLFFGYGSGANGKTTFLETIQGIFGDYAAPLRSEALMSSDHAQHPTTWAGLVGVRMAIAAEVERGSRFAESLVKDVTGGSVISARRMREDFWSFAPQFKLWICGNDRPVVRGADDGIWRRLRLVPFTVSFVGREDRTLPERLRAEAPGILRWAVDGAREWYAQGLGEPACVRDATASYRAEQDLFGQWAADELELHPQRRATNTELRQAYERWCSEHGAHTVGPRDFHDRLARLGAVAQRGNHGRFWEGVGLVRRAP